MSFKVFPVNATQQELEQLTCRVCEHYYTLPIRECLNGHSICGRCFHQLEVMACPFCRVALSFYSSNDALEQLISSRTKSCEFALCAKKIPLTDYASHYSSCTFNDLINCPVPVAGGGTCGDELPLSKVEEHLRNAHQIATRKGRSLIEFGADPDSEELLQVAASKIKGNIVLIYLSRRAAALYEIVMVPLVLREKLGNKIKLSKDRHNLVYEKSTHGLKSAYASASFLLDEREIDKFNEQLLLRIRISVFSYTGRDST